jgi:hypothetical protein
MTIPTQTIVVNTTPDADGYVYSEDWSDPALASMVWGPLDGSTYVFLKASDGLMGSRFMRVGFDDLRWTGCGSYQGGMLFDPEADIEYVYNARLNFVPGDYGVGDTLGHMGRWWMALGVLWQAQHGGWSGPTSEGMGPQAGEATNQYSLGQYSKLDVDYGGWSPPLLAEPFSGDIVALRVTRAAGLYKTVWSGVNGGALVDGGGGPWGRWGIGALFFVGGIAGGDPANLDIGAIRAKGRPMAGWQDASFALWSRGPGAATVGISESGRSMDNSGLNLGGLTGTDSLNAAHFDDEGYFPNPSLYTGSAINGTWSAVSPVIGLATGAYYNRLRLKVQNLQNGYVRLYLRTAVDVPAQGLAAGDLLPDAWVPGNSTGLVSSAPLYGGTIWDPQVQVVSLRSIPVGVQFYLEAQGSTRASPTPVGIGPSNLTYYSQPRLCGTWVDFTDLAPNAPPPITLVGTRGSLVLTGRAGSLLTYDVQPVQLVGVRSMLALSGRSGLIRLASLFPFLFPDGSSAPVPLVWNGIAWVEAPGISPF